MKTNYFQDVDDTIVAGYFVLIPNILWRLMLGIGDTMPYQPLVPEFYFPSDFTMLANTMTVMGVSLLLFGYLSKIAKELRMIKRELENRSNI